jgi:flagellar hook-associated protein 2
MAFTYSGSTSQSITVTSTSGIATQLYQIAKDYSSSTGVLQTQITSLTTRDDELQQRVDDINSAASTLQSRLETQYAKYQAAIETANSTLDYLKALLNSSSSN